MAQVVARGYAVSEGAERLGISTKSLYTWKAPFSKSAPRRQADTDLETELRRVKKELSRVIEERDRLKKGEPWGATGSRPMTNAYFARESR